MNATVIRSRPLSALIVGATGINVLRIVTAFEARRILTLRAGTIAEACERIVVDMPHVVLAFVAPATAVERDALQDRALAVGALVVQVDPNLDEAALQQVLDTTIHAALERKLRREEAEAKAQAPAGSDVPPDLDDGWND